MAVGGTDVGVRVGVGPTGVLVAVGGTGVLVGPPAVIEKFALLMSKKMLVAHFTFQRAVLVMGVDGKERRVIIERDAKDD